MDSIDSIRLSVPGTLFYRDVVLRAVASTCRLVRFSTAGAPRFAQADYDEDFDHKVVSAVGEAFNNVAIHAYRGRPAGLVHLELDLHHDRITIRLSDTGIGFDPSLELAPDLASLPESHMGLFIMRSCMDEVTYLRGDPPAGANVLTLTKRYVDTGRPLGA